MIVHKLVVRPAVHSDPSWYLGHSPTRMACQHCWSAQWKESRENGYPKYGTPPLVISKPLKVDFDVHHSFPTCNVERKRPLLPPVCTRFFCFDTFTRTNFDWCPDTSTSHSKTDAIQRHIYLYHSFTALDILANMATSFSNSNTRMAVCDTPTTRTIEMTVLFAKRVSFVPYFPCL
jgi:hypothetical protein